MATRKQQKRRHQRTLGRGRVYSDSSSESHTEPARPQRKSQPARGVPRPPSWLRTGKRAAVFAALFVLLTEVLPIGKMTDPQRAVFTVYIFVMMWLAGMMADGFIWRRYAKRQQQSPPS